nr:MAG TPA: Minor capsid protein [Caudoviricetes sp.]
MNGNFDSIARKIESTIRERAESAMRRSLEELKEKIDEYTPEDTYNLTKNNQIREGEWSGDRLVGKVENSSNYAVYVEY